MFKRTNFLRAGNRLTVVVAAMLSVGIAFAAPQSPSTQKAEPIEREHTSVLLDGVVNSFVDRELARRKLSLRLAPIRSAADLQAHLQTQRGTKSPINQLSSAARDRFIANLEFGDNGLAGYYYADLESELTPSQIWRVLSLFGVEHTTPMLKRARVVDETDEAISSMVFDGGDYFGQDHMEYKCESRGTCAAAMRYICTSNC